MSCFDQGRGSLCCEGSELQAYQLVDQPLCLSRGVEQVLEEFSISGALALLSNVVVAGHVIKGVMARVITETSFS